MAESNTDLEIAGLRAESGISGTASLEDLREAVYGPSEYAFWAALSPLAVGSLADHKIAAMQSALGISSGSMADVSRAFWAEGL